MNVTYAMAPYPQTARVYRDGEYFGCISTHHHEMPRLTVIYGETDYTVISQAIPARRICDFVDSLARLERVH